MRIPKLIIPCAMAIAALPNASAVAASRTPNIVVILADDFGVGDIQALFPDNKIRTPALDRLVREGMSFTDAHSPSAVCTPTRYGLMTGRYAWRTRLQEWVLAAYEPPLIDANRPTLPGFLRKQGYRTVCIGKWHLGWEWPGPQPGRMTEPRNGQKELEWDFTKPVRSGPAQRGFDYYFGPDVPNFPPFTFIENDRVVIQPAERYKADPSQGVILPRGFEGSPIAPGWEFDEILPELTRRAVQRIHDLAKQDKPFFLYFALTSPHEPVSPSKEFRGRSGIAPIADFVMETDWSVGEVVRAIDEAGIDANTLVLFTADNGHSHYTGWEDLVAAGHKPSGPYRGHKGDIWEGGHRVPLIVRWPKHMAGNATNPQLVCLTDVFSTLAELVETNLPAAGAEDSYSFLAAALGKSPAQPQRTALVSHSNHGEFAWREGPWKLVFRNRGPLQTSRGQPRVAELYNLDEDIGEQHDLSAQHPEIVRRMREALEEVIARGSSRGNPGAANDTPVRFDITQTSRWGPEAGEARPALAPQDG
ncbi:MAG: sulfatase family protein [Opitutaceae bacterium]